MPRRNPARDRTDPKPPRDELEATRESTEPREDPEQRTPSLPFPVVGMAGFNQHFTKPVDPEVLQEFLGRTSWDEVAAEGS